MAGASHVDMPSPALSAKGHLLWKLTRDTKEGKFIDFKNVTEPELKFIQACIGPGIILEEAQLNLNEGLIERGGEVVDLTDVIRHSTKSLEYGPVEPELLIIKAAAILDGDQGFWLLTQPEREWVAAIVKLDVSDLTSESFKEKLSLQWEAFPKEVRDFAKKDMLERLSGLLTDRAKSCTQMVKHLSYKGFFANDGVTYQFAQQLAAMYKELKSSDISGKKITFLNDLARLCACDSDQKAMTGVIQEVRAELKKFEQSCETGPQVPSSQAQGAFFQQGAEAGAEAGAFEPRN